MQESYYIYSSGNLTQKDNTLRFTAIDGNVKDLPIENIKEIYIAELIFKIRNTCTFLQLLSILHRKFLPKGNKTCRSAFG